MEKMISASSGVDVAAGRHGLSDSQEPKASSSTSSDLYYVELRIICCCLTDGTNQSTFSGQSLSVSRSVSSVSSESCGEATLGEFLIWV